MNLVNRTQERETKRSHEVHELHFTTIDFVVKENERFLAMLWDSHVRPAYAILCLFILNSLIEDVVDSIRKSWYIAVKNLLNQTCLVPKTDVVPTLEKVEFQSDDHKIHGCTSVANFERKHMQKFDKFLLSEANVLIASIRAKQLLQLKAHGLDFEELETIRMNTTQNICSYNLNFVTLSSLEKYLSDLELQFLEQVKQAIQDLRIRSISNTQSSDEFLCLSTTGKVFSVT